MVTCDIGFYLNIIIIANISTSYYTSTTAESTNKDVVGTQVDGYESFMQHSAYFSWTTWETSTRHSAWCQKIYTLLLHWLYFGFYKNVVQELVFLSFFAKFENVHEKLNWLKLKIWKKKKYPNQTYTLNNIKQIQWKI